MENKPKYPAHYPVYGHCERIFNLRLASAAFVEASEDYHASPADGPIAKRYGKRKRLLLQEIGLDNEPYQDGRPPYVMPGTAQQSGYCPHCESDQMPLADDTCRDCGKDYYPANAIGMAREALPSPNC